MGQLASSGPTYHLSRSQRQRKLESSTAAANELVAGQIEAAAATEADVAVDESVTKCPSPLNVIQYTYDHSCY